MAKQSSSGELKGEEPVAATYTIEGIVLLGSKLTQMKNGTKMREYSFVHGIYPFRLWEVNPKDETPGMQKAVEKGKLEVRLNVRDGFLKLGFVSWIPQS